MKLSRAEKIRFELAICKQKGRWHESDNSDLFAVGEDDDYINPEIKTLSDGWSYCAGNLDLSSVINGRNIVVTELLEELVESNLLPPSMATKINITKYQNQRYFDDMDYVTDAYCALFHHEDLLKDAVDHIIKANLKNKPDA